MTADIAVVLVAWNGREDLERCLVALDRQTLAPAKIVVVDNASTDGTAEMVASGWPRVALIEAGANIGFAWANNLALTAMSSPWVALLNVDTEPEPPWLAALASAAAAGGERLGGVASLQVFRDRPQMVNSTGIAVDPAGIAWDRLGGAPVEGALRPAPVFGPSAGAGLYRRAALLDAAEDDGAGPEVFDPKYFMFLEDVDLAWRMRLRGWTSVYAPEAVVRHAGSGAAGEGSAFKNRLLARNKVWTVIKDYPGRPLLRRLPLILLYDLASVPYRVVVNGQGAALAGRIDALGGVMRAWRRRRAIQARRTAAWPEIEAAMEPWTAPWRVPARYAHLAGRGGARQG